MKTSKHITKNTERANAPATNAIASTANAVATTREHAPDPFFAEPYDPVKEGRAQGFEVIRRLLVWQSNAPTLEKRGLRMNVALYHLAPFLIDGRTLEQIGDEAGITRQSVHAISRDFIKSFGLDQ